MPTDAKWRESQLQAMLALGDSPQDAERVLAAMERIAPDDPSRLPDPESFAAMFGQVTPEDIRDAMADWMVRARPEWKRLLTAQVKETASEFNPWHDRRGRFAVSPGGGPLDVPVKHKIELPPERLARIQTDIVFDAGWDAFKGGGVKYLSQQGFTEEEVGDPARGLTGIRGLIHRYSYGGESQKNAMDEIEQHLRDNTRIGQLLRLNSDVEEQLYNAWDNGRKARYDKRAEEIEQDYAWRERPSDLTTKEWHAEKQEKLDRAWRETMEEPHYLYRLGQVGGRNIESWTTHEKGFEFDVRRGGATGIGYTERKTIQQLHRDGYRILAGVNLISGAPGEGEITFIRSSLIHGPTELASEFNPHHDALGRFAAGSAAVGLSYHALGRIGTQGRANVTSVRDALERLQTVKTPDSDWSYPVRQGDRLRGHLIGTDGVVKTVVGAWYKPDKLPPALSEADMTEGTLSLPRSIAWHLEHLTDAEAARFCQEAEIDPPMTAEQFRRLWEGDSWDDLALLLYIRREDEPRGV